MKRRRLVHMGYSWLLAATVFLETEKCVGSVVATSDSLLRSLSSRRLCSGVLRFIISLLHANVIFGKASFPKADVQTTISRCVQGLVGMDGRCQHVHCCTWQTQSGLMGGLALLNPHRFLHGLSALSQKSPGLQDPIPDFHFGGGPHAAPPPPPPLRGSDAKSNRLPRSPPRVL